MKRKIILLLFATLISVAAFAQLEIKDGSFKKIDGFANQNPELQTDANNVYYAVIKVKTVNINDKQRHDLHFEGNKSTFIELEYKVGEVWVYISSEAATFLKISHPDLSSTEFWFPIELLPKKGYELTLVNTSKSAVDDENVTTIMNRLDKIESNTKNVAARIDQNTQTNPAIESYSFLTLNASYNNYGKLQYGLTFGSMKKMGWFGSLMTNFNFKGLSTEYQCGNDFLVDGKYPLYTGKEVYSSISAIGGVMFRITDPIALRVGAGFGMRSYAYEMVDGKYVKNTDISTTGLEVSVGAHYKYKKLVVSLDFVTTNFKYYEAKIGIGMGY